MGEGKGEGELKGINNNPLPLIPSRKERGECGEELGHIEKQ